MVVIDSKEFAKHLQNNVGYYIDSSLLINDDYTYVDNPLVEEREVSRVKSTVVKILSFITYFFDRML